MLDLNNHDSLNTYFETFNNNVFKNAPQVNNIGSHRYRSWEICRNAFLKYTSGLLNNEPTRSEAIDALALHLAFYLASWGMYRGSSFLLQLDYSVHKGAVELLLNKKYLKLFDSDYLIKSDQDRIKYLELLFGTNDKTDIGIVGELTDYYKQWRNAVKDKNSDKISNTLITKILLGVYGCVPAYDRFFCDALGHLKICKTFGKKGVNELLKKIGDVTMTDYFEKTARPKYFNSNKVYTHMKMMDILLFEAGQTLQNK